MYLSYLTLSTCMGRAFLLTSMCILGKNGSIPRQEKKTKTKKRMVPTPSTKAEDGEGHHPCRKSSLIYSLAQPVEDRHYWRKSSPLHCLHHQRELYRKQEQIKDSQNSSSAIIMSGKILYICYSKYTSSDKTHVQISFQFFCVIT